MDTRHFPITPWYERPGRGDRTVSAERRCSGVWTLKTPNIDAEHSERISMVDIIEYLSWQLLRLPGAHSANSGVKLTRLRVKAARIEKEWLAILGSILENFGRVYIVIDLEVVDCGGSRTTADFWPRALLEIFRGLEARGARTIVKVVLLTYGTFVPSLGSSETDSNMKFSVVKTPLKGAPQSIRTTTRNRGRLAFRNRRGRVDWTRGWNTDL